MGCVLTHGIVIKIGLKHNLSKEKSELNRPISWLMGILKMYASREPGHYLFDDINAWDPGRFK